MEAAIGKLLCKITWLWRRAEVVDVLCRCLHQVFVMRHALSASHKEGVAYKSCPCWIAKTGGRCHVCCISSSFSMLASNYAPSVAKKKANSLELVPVSVMKHQNNDSTHNHFVSRDKSESLQDKGEQTNSWNRELAPSYDLVFRIAVLHNPQIWLGAYGLP